MTTIVVIELGKGFYGPIDTHWKSSQHPFGPKENEERRIGSDRSCPPTRSASMGEFHTRIFLHDQQSHERVAITCVDIHSFRHRADLSERARSRREAKTEILRDDAYVRETRVTTS